MLFKRAQLPVSRRLCFAGYEFDPVSRRLTRHGEAVALGGQPLAILALLLRPPARVVARETMKRQLWPRAGNIDTSRRLNTAVRALRVALEDTAARPRFVETVRGVGYRFVAPVSEPRDGSHLVAAAVLSCVALLLLAADTVTTHGLDAPANLGVYLRAVSAFDSQRDADRHVRAGLAKLLVQHPDYRPAAMLLAQFAVRDWRRNPDSNNLARAQTALDQLLRQHEATPVALTLQGELALYGHWDWRAAETWLTGALKMTPNDAETHRLLAWLYLNRGAPGKAWLHTHALLAQAPLSPATKADVGWLLLRLAKPEMALSICVDLDATRARGNTLSCRHTAQARLGDLVAARHTALELMREFNGAPDALRRVAAATPLAGYRMFLDWRTVMISDASWFQRAQILADAGRFGAAEKALAKALRAKEPHLIKLVTTHELRKLRGTASYQEIIAALM